MKSHHLIIAVVLAMATVILSGCKKENKTDSGNDPGNENVLKVTTYTPHDITSTTVVCGAEAFIPEGMSLERIGICWDTMPNPSFSTTSFIYSKNVDEPFVLTLIGLVPEKTYYVKAFGTSWNNGAEGEEKSFTTLPAPAIVPSPWSPEPAAGGTVPASVLPTELYDEVSQYFTIYSGENPPAFTGEFVAQPYVLTHSSVENDSAYVHPKRMIAFFENNGQVDFWGTNWDNQTQMYYLANKNKLSVIGDGDGFTCYYIEEAQNHGDLPRKSYIFSGRWDESYGGLKDFQAAEIQLTADNSHPQGDPIGTFRIFADSDGLSQDTVWRRSR